LSTGHRRGQVRVQNQQLIEGWQSAEAERAHYRELFELAPAAYLLTDRVGVIREVNRRAASLLGVASHFLVGRPLAMFVAAEDRQGLRDRLNRPGGLDLGAWQLLELPRPATRPQTTTTIGAKRPLRCWPGWSPADPPARRS
jgi:PAS domain-containing protein